MDGTFGSTTSELDTMVQPRPQVLMLSGAPVVLIASVSTAPISAWFMAHMDILLDIDKDCGQTTVFSS